jgi:hypothetical protein
VGTFLWSAWTAAFAVWGVAIGAVALNGITQISTGGPGFLPFERWLRRRRPATQHDFILQGAAQVAQAFGLALIAAPTSFMAFISTTDLTTGWRPPAPPTIPTFVPFAVFAMVLGSLLLSMVLVVSSYVIGTKVNYVRTGIETEPQARAAKP